MVLALPLYYLVPLAHFTHFTIYGTTLPTVECVRVRRCGLQVFAFDTRMLPPEDPTSKKAPPDRVTLSCSLETEARISCLDAAAGFVVAGDSEGGIHVWDVTLTAGSS